MLREHELVNAFNPETATRLLQPSELEGLSKFQLRVMRNEILARHGYVFKSREMTEYFERQPWYRPDPDFDEAQLSTVERENVEMIARFEKGKIDAGTPSERRAIVKDWGAAYARSVGGIVASTQYELLDVDSDGDRDAVAVYALNYGGSGSSGLVAVFENDDGRLRQLSMATAGGSGVWLPTKAVSAGNGRITLLAQIWLRDDAHCCPSGSGNVDYWLQAGRLVCATPGFE